MTDWITTRGPAEFPLRTLVRIEGVAHWRFRVIGYWGNRGWREGLVLEKQGINPRHQPLAEPAMRVRKVNCDD